MTKFYTVVKGRIPGVYSSWAECKVQTDGFPKAIFKSYKTRTEAELAFESQSINTTKPIDTPVENTFTYDVKSISVDASCLGNPGVMEYQGVVTGTGFNLFSSTVYPVGTNNIGEFLALVDAIRYLVSEGYDYPIYTDSKTAIAWVRNKKVRTSLEKTAQTEQLLNDIDEAILFLTNTNYKADIRKWETNLWGESKADFGRK